MRSTRPAARFLRRPAVALDPEALSAVRLSLAVGGRSLVLSKRGGIRLAIVDTQTFKVTALAKP